jgi:UDP-glucuronate 4-epimerase
MKTLITGVAGFIGYHTALRLLAAGRSILGIDNLNDYYDPRLKRARLARLRANPNFEFARIDISDRGPTEELFQRERFDGVIHLAAQAGVRASLENPHLYVSANLAGFLNVLEGCRRNPIRHLIYASSSSVYGAGASTPFGEADPTDSPVSFYAATKKANELMAHTYSHLFDIPSTGLRFFTVYGPWGRPDMAPFRFARAIARGRRIDVFNYGRMWRDFTYIDDVTEGIFRIAALEPGGYRLFNIGRGEPVGLNQFIATMERAFERRVPKRYLPLRPGDMPSTHADTEEFCRFTGFRPSTPLDVGVGRFVEWYREFYEEARDGHRSGSRRILRAS